MQTKTGSVIESVTNTAVGFVISLLFWQFVIVPVWHLDVSQLDNLSITAAFTVLSILRSYVLRRFFTHIKRLHSND